MFNVANKAVFEAKIRIFIPKALSCEKVKKNEKNFQIFFVFSLDIIIRLKYHKWWRR